MKKLASLVSFILLSISLMAGEREAIWPKNKMPDYQDHQIAAMTDESRLESFEADKHRIAYI